MRSDTVVVIALPAEQSLERFEKLLAEYSIATRAIKNLAEAQNYDNSELVFLTVLPLEKGFRFGNLLMVAEGDLFPVVKSVAVNAGSIHNILRQESNLKETDLVIHVEYGLGKLVGLETVEAYGVANDFLKIEYADNANLFVPIDKFNLLSKYSDYDETVKLDSLGNSKWSEKKAKLKLKLKDMAKELMAIAGRRKIIKAPVCIAKTGEYEEFCNAFPFVETADQLKSIEQIAGDLSSGHPMDRLLCGDVAFGKTEVAMRAAFIVAAEGGHQVAVIAPTTLLARQHYIKFKNRFQDTGLVVESLSRVNSPKEAREVRQSIANGKCSIVVGTHALLSKSITFKNLALVVVDEEQRFGVKQKEKLKELKNSCHFLAMSATPIPRTLQMSMVGIRDISILAIPPKDRININTFTGVFDDVIIREAIYREIYREGAIFFVVPRIKDIDEVVARLQNIVPDVKYNIVHGQMDAQKVDEIMNDFYDRKFSLLIATTILENGIDIPFANTMIVYRANHFGLAQLYQLRGRVGRSDKQAYCYLTLKSSEKITDDAKKRISIMANIDGLNAGFRIASEDMELRGSGNIVGEDQSGFIKDVGVELYNQMLRDAVRNIGKLEEATEEAGAVNLKLGVSTIIPVRYINNTSLRMKYYRAIADIDCEATKKKMELELADRFGEVPDSVSNLIRFAVIKHECAKLNILALEYKNNKLYIQFGTRPFKNSDKLINFIANNSSICGFSGNNAIVFKYNSYNSVLDFVDFALDVLRFEE